MNESSKRTRRIRLLADIAFVAYLLAQLLLAHTLPAQAAMALFCGCVFLLFLDGKRVFFDRFFVFYALLALWGLIGVLAGRAADGAQAMAMVKTLLVNLVFLFCLFQYFVQRQDMERCFSLYMLAGAVGCVIVCVLSYKHLLHYRFGQAAGINPNDVAAFLLPAFAFAVHRALTKKRVWPALAAVFFFAMILLTGSRKGLLGAGLFTVCYVLWSDRKHIARNLIILLALGVAGVCALLFIPALYSMAGWRIVWTVKTLLGTAGPEELELSILERGNMIAEGLSLFAKRPLTGWGLDCFAKISSFGTYAHNNFIELLTDGGLPALLLYYAPLAALLVRGFRRGAADAVVRAGTCMLLAQLVIDVAVVSYYERGDLFNIIVPLAALRLYGQKPEDGESFWKYVKNPYRVFMLMGDRGMLNFLPDEPNLRLLYRANLGKKADLKHPKTFNEKLNWLKLHDRREVYTVMSDKYAARDYIAGKIGPQYLLPLYGVWDDAESVDFDALPARFVIKTTHDSGGVRVVTDKSKTDLSNLRRFLKKRLKKRYYMTGRERQYEKIQPRVIAEAYVGDDAGNPPVDYKFFCFDGQVKLILVCTERKTGVKFWYCDRERNILPCTELCKNAPEHPFDWPEETEEMIALAEKIAAGFPCLRVDFFVTADGIRSSELTLYDYSGFCPLFIDDWDERLGELITAI